MEETQVRSKFLVLGSNMLAGIGGLGILGYWIDRHFETRFFLFTIIGVFLGFAWSMYEMMKTVKWIDRETKNQTKKKNDL